MMANEEQGRRTCVLHSILHLIILLSVVAAATYACVHWHTTRDTGMEVDVLRQEVHFFFKTELSSGLFSLREQFQ
jgi:hypothetical protein